jgi:hypothetical protein
MKQIVAITTAQLYPLQPLFSIDNNPTNKAAELSRMGLTESDMVSLPTYSPDMHQVVEHTIAEFKKGLLQAVFQHDGQAMSVAKAQQLAEEVFASIKPEHIAKNALKLVCCWQQIATPKGVRKACADGVVRAGTGGDWATADLR